MTFRPRWAENALKGYQVDTCEKDCAGDAQGCPGFSFNASDPDNLQCAHCPLPARMR